jgi:hypothetical protein
MNRDSATALQVAHRQAEPVGMRFVSDNGVKTNQSFRMAESCTEQKKAGRLPASMISLLLLACLFLLFQFPFDQQLREFRHNFPRNLAHYSI